MDEMNKNQSGVGDIGDSASPVTDEAVEASRVSAGEEEDLSLEKLEDLYENSFHKFVEGELVAGTILNITDSHVIIDIGYKSEGMIPTHEFYDDKGVLTISKGDRIEVLLEATENLDGRLVLSKEKALKMKVWDDIEEAYKNDKVIEGRVIDRIKGGLSVDVGVRAFLPGSQVDVRPIRNLDSLRGEKIRVKVIKLNKRRGNIVLSRKEVIEAENKDRKRETLKSLKEGAVVNGVVKNITEYGAFVDLGGIDGLLHITDMSWGRINHPSELFAVADEIEVVVLKFDVDTDRVSLGYKQRWADPWENVDEKFPINARVRGKIVSITDYGAFIELEEGVEGLIHVSEMSWSKRLKHPSKMVSVGQEVEPEARRISLGLKQIEPNPWVLVRERYREGDIIRGKVRNITDFGAFVEIEEGIDGLVHVSDMSWTKRIKHPSEVLKKGEEIEATVLHIDVDNQRLSLGLKQMTPNTLEEYFAAHRIGNVVECTVLRITNFGVFVELGEGVEGLIHTSELDVDRVRNPEEVVSVGDKLKAQIIKMDREENKIGLSVKAMLEEETRKSKEAYSRKTSGKATLADVIGQDALERLDEAVRSKAKKAKDKEPAEKAEEKKQAKGKKKEEPEKARKKAEKEPEKAAKETKKAEKEADKAAKETKKAEKEEKTKEKETKKAEKPAAAKKEKAVKAKEKKEDKSEKSAGKAKKQKPDATPSEKKSGKKKAADSAGAGEEKGS
jgi:small subunit ribosomal protein S1